jgi:hypothetical protein
MEEFASGRLLCHFLVLVLVCLQPLLRPLRWIMASILERGHQRLKGHHPVSKPTYAAKGKFLSNVLRL